MSDDAIHVFGQWAERGRAEPMGRSHAPRAMAALEKLPVQSGQRVLDLGCGEGWAARELAARVAPDGEAVGVDGSEAMLSRARFTPRPCLSYVHGRLLALPFADGTFDHAFSMEALYYVPLDEALAEVARVLRSGGWLAACTDFYEEHAACHAWPEELGLSMDLRSTSGWVDAVRGAGFDQVRSQRLPDPGKPDHPGTLAIFANKKA